jgi:protein phosphatase 2C
VQAPKEDKGGGGGGGGPLLDMISENERNWVVGDDVITRDSEEDDSLSLEGDPILDCSCSLSVASETSSLCGEDFLSFEATFEVGTPSSVDIEKSAGGVDIIPKTADLGDLNVDAIVSDPLSVAGIVEEEVGDGSDAKTSAVVPKLTLERGASGTISRSVFEVDYIPLWGFTSVCGRRPEMEDAVAAVPYFLKIHIQMLIGDRLLDGMSNCLPLQTAHFFGVYDGHGGSQVTYPCALYPYYLFMFLWLSSYCQIMLLFPL